MFILSPRYTVLFMSSLTVAICLLPRGSGGPCRVREEGGKESQGERGIYNSRHITPAPFHTSILQDNSRATATANFSMTCGEG